MNRYLDATEEAYDILYDLINERFTSYGTLNFKIVFDTKRRNSRGRLVLASVEVATEKLRFLSSDDSNPDGFDYLIIIDNIAWEYASDADKRRLISHELNHVFIDEKGRLKLVGHDIEDFVAEIKANADDPDWARNLAMLTSSIYEQKNEEV